jgi:hypothetical protein
MRTVKSRARKQDTSLTVTKATSQARRHVDAIMPGVMATVESRYSYDLDTNTSLVITTITFPATDYSADLIAALKTLADVRSVQAFAARAVITRTR